MAEKTYTITAEIATATSWNVESQDWSGVQYVKEFDGEKTIITGKLTRLQLRDAITELLYLDDDFFAEADLFINGNIVSVGIIEAGNGYPDPTGNYLADYAFSVVEVTDIDLQEALR